MRTRTIVLLLISLSVALAAGAQQSERVLVPVVYTGAGEFGSYWDTSLQVLNRTAAPYRTPGVTFLTAACPSEGCFVDDLPSGAYGRVRAIHNEPAAPNGVFMYVPAGMRNRLSFSLKVSSELNGRALWTEIPVVDEDEFRSDAVWLLSARVAPPSGVTERLTLRVYDADGRGGRVRVNAYPWYALAQNPVASTELELRTRSGSAGADQPFFPAYAQMRVEEAFPYAKHGVTIWNLELVPLARADGTTPRIWGFVTMTNNETNQVTVISPQ